MESLKTSLQQELEQLSSSLPGLELPPTSQAPSSLYADLEAMIETINAEYPMLDQVPPASSDDPVPRLPPPASRSNTSEPTTKSSDPSMEKPRSASQKPKRRRRQSEIQSADGPRKKKTPGRINAPRLPNGRFLKQSERRTGKSLELVRQESAIDESPEETSESQTTAFSMPFPSELVNDIYNLCIMPHLKLECMSEMEVLVRKNLFFKHYRPQLILFLASPRSVSTYKSLDALVAAAIRKLGF
jgi:hypothetical protein